MALTDEQLKALGLDMPPPDVAMAPAPPPAAILPASAPPQYPKSILGDQIAAGQPVTHKDLTSLPHEQGKELYQESMPKITSDPGTTDYFRQRQEQLDYKTKHPWGDPISAHPGVLGKIAHGLATVGNIAGDIVAPGTMALIPGTQLHNEIERAGNERGIQAGERGAEEEATTAATKEATAEAPEKLKLEQEKAAQPKQKEEDWTIVPGLAGPNGEPVQQEKNSGQVRFAPLSGVKPSKTPADTATQNKETFQHAIGVLRGEGLLGAGDVTNYAKIAQAIQTSKQLNDKEKNDAVGYLAANPTPGTNLTVHVAGNEQAQAAAINKQFEGKEVLAHLPDGRRVQMSYADAQAQNIPAERLIALSSKEAQENRDKAASVQTTFTGLDRYRTDFKNSAPQLTKTDRDALRVLASHNQSGQTGSILSGLIDELPLAGPLSSYANKLLEGTMTSDQYKQLSPAGKKLVSDYFTSIIDNFANMKAVMGTVGRNPQMLQAEVNTIPLPFLDWDSAAIQFDNKRVSLQGRAGSMPELYSPKSK
jgi:hypothetical protein